MGCITLLSDFGLQDASVASAKGILMQHVPERPIIDISHLIEPFHLQQAAYILTSAYRNFAKGTCHVLLFDLFSEKNPRLLLCQKEGHYFLAPDNGILSLAFDSEIEKVWKLFELQSENALSDWLRVTGETIKQLGSKQPSDMKLEVCKLKNAPQHWIPKVDNNTLECHVIHIDRFENVVINITKSQFELLSRGRPFRIQYMRNEEITEISRQYSDVKEGDKLCRFNGTGYLEISINRGKAASLFGLKIHREHHLMYNTIKIFFE